MYSYYCFSEKWSRLLNTPTDSCTLAVVNNLLTTIGGSPITNKLYSLIGKGKEQKWTNEFPPMPTKRRRTIALCSRKALVVAGGDSGDTLCTVEIMNTETLTWSIAAELPQKLRVASATLTAGDRLYILGGVHSSWNGTHAVYTCSLSALLRSSCSPASPGDIWERVADLPVTWATCVSIQNRVLAVGGRQPDGNFSTAIHMFDPDTNLWQVISHMSVARRQCFAVVLPTTHALMVVGGWSATTGNRIDSVELASITK